MGKALVNMPGTYTTAFWILPDENCLQTTVYARCGFKYFLST